MKNYYSSDFKLGVLGGGQLGRMLLAETQKLDIHTSILESNKNAPCAEICNTFLVGDLLDFDAVYNFGKTVNVLTIEIENVNLDALDKLEDEGLTIFPKPKDLSISQLVSETILSLRCFLIDQKVTEFKIKTQDVSKDHSEVLEDVLNYSNLKMLLSRKLNRVL